MDDISIKDRPETEQKNERDMSARAALPPRGPWLVDVDVYLDDVTDPQKPRFHLETYLPMDPNGVITFHNRGRDGFEIRFNLIDNTGQGYLFPPPPKKDHALWSRQGRGCPPDNYDRQWHEFEVVRVIEPALETLVVRNRNETVTEFGYTLRVTNNNGATYIPLDPGGNNQNGGR